MMNKNNNKGDNSKNKKHTNNDEYNSNNVE